MSRTITGALLLAALWVAALGVNAHATLLSLPKALKTSPFLGLEMSLPIWGPSTESFYCIEHLSACQPQPKEPQLEQVAL